MIFLKRVILISLSLVIAFSLNTQASGKKKKKKKTEEKVIDGSFNKSGTHLSFGYGFFNTTTAIFNTFKTQPNYKISGYGPFHIKYERALTDQLGLGLSVNLSQSKVRWDYGQSTPTNGYSEGFYLSSLATNLRLNYHFINKTKLDVYAGIGLGMNMSTTKYFNTSNTSGITPELTAALPLGLELTAGMRYYFDEDIGVYVEGGYAQSLVQAGLTIKFGPYLQ